jgi:hypothetical protein
VPERRVGKQQINQTVTHGGDDARTFAPMHVVDRPPTWPADPDHREAIDTLLVMAEAEGRWGEPRRALELLGRVEQLVGTLPKPYERLRWRCLDAVGRNVRPLVG